MLQSPLGGLCGHQGGSDMPGVYLSPCHVPFPSFSSPLPFLQLFPAVVTSEGNRCLRTNQALPRHNTPSATHSKPASQGHREWALPGLRAKAEHCLSEQMATSFWFSRSLSMKQGSFQFKDMLPTNVLHNVYSAHHSQIHISCDYLTFHGP